MSHWLHPDAEAELGDASVYYARHASRAIAEAFLQEYERVLGLLIENQQLGQHGNFGLQVFHFDRFPYTLIYEEDTERGPQIYAVAHQRRKPGYWQGRV
ncbi:type II toxin-antitoxin system RelE/ParE family toxin [Azohydromonas aeria]|uniref:type II toxin-antitoxin system RelE/ParE family toxin n=1 Tax=Azohydromonas aeria TaxID=2590212 RepID=UPI0012FBCA5A|nr:type II toxin-antitoxin system RelE/ParE family toxin [Azohydromonas aeria]